MYSLAVCVAWPCDWPGQVVCMYSLAVCVAWPCDWPGQVACGLSLTELKQHRTL